MTDSPYSPIPPSPSSPQPGPPTYGFAPPAAPPAPRSSLAVVAVILLGVVLLLQLILPFVQNTLLLSPDLDYAVYGIVANIAAVVIGLIAVVAVILGAIALARPGRRVLAGIAVGGAGVIVFNTVVGILSSLMLSAMSY